MRFRTAFAISLAGALVAGCNSKFFKLSSENEGTPPSKAPPADTARVKPTPTKAPVEKSKPAKPVVVKPPASEPPKKAATPPPVVAAAPPGVRVTPPVAAPADTFDIESPATGSDSAGVARLVQLAVLWDAVAQFHPAIESRGVAWDSALVRAVPRVRMARNNEQLRAAIAPMLRLLDDPVTGFGGTPDALISIGTGAIDGVIESPDSVLIIDASARALSDSTTRALLRSIASRARNYPRVVVDLRSKERWGVWAFFNAESDRLFEATGLAASLTTDTLIPPVERSRTIGAFWSMHDGDVQFDEVESKIEPGDWRVGRMHPLEGRAALLKTTPAPIRRGRPVAAPVTIERRIVVVANQNSFIPSGLRALISNHRATLVVERGFDELLQVRTVHFPLAGTELRLRLGELLNADCTIGIRVDTIVDVSAAADTTGAAIRTALNIVRTGKAPRGTSLQQSTRAVFPAVFDTAQYPVLGARVLGVFRLWSAMRTQHAHRDAYDEDVDEVFARAIPMAEAARNADEYARAIYTLASAMDDAAVRLRGESFAAVTGGLAAPFQLQWIENHPIITAIASDSIARALGIAVGDEVTAVDGFPIAAWLTEHRRVGPVSNDVTRLAAQMEAMRRGESGSGSYRVRDVRGVERTITVPRRAEFVSGDAFRTRRNPPVRDMGNGTIYIDLTSGGANSGDIEKAAQSKPTTLLLDLRGAWYTADPYRLLRARVPTARAVMRGASQPCFAVTLRAAQETCADERRTQPIVWEVPVSDVTPIETRVVVLIDERTSGAAERLALLLEQGANAILVGSPSAGAFSTPHWLSLPGGLDIGIPLVEWRRLDGGQLNRLGLTPAVEFKPTIRAIRNGADDVPERASAWIQERFNPAPRRRR